MAKPAGHIRSVLIPVTGGRVLLPNATVAEVITFANPDPIEDSPNWCMGRVVWRGWRIPVFSLSILSAWVERESEAGAKIAVLKALGGNKDMPFMAMVTQGFPRLVTIGAEDLEVISQGEETDTGGQSESDAEAFTVEMDPEPLNGETSPAILGEAEPGPIKAVVSHKGERAVIPDLQAIERRLLEVL